jgi:WD40 repeat protein
VRIWDVQTGELRAMHLAEAGTVKAVAFSPSGAELVVAWEDGLIRVLNLTTGQISQELVTGGFLNDLALSPDGEWLLIGEGWPSFAARLVERRSGRLLRVFAGHTAPVESVAFNARGTQMLTGADVVRLWDLAELETNLRAAWKPSGVELTWDRGVLEQSTSLNGPWAPVSAASPWTDPMHVPNRFFRVRTHQEE